MRARGSGGLACSRASATLLGKAALAKAPGCGARQRSPQGSAASLDLPAWVPSAWRLPSYGRFSPHKPRHGSYLNLTLRADCDGVRAYSRTGAGGSARGCKAGGAGCWRVYPWHTPRHQRGTVGTETSVPEVRGHACPASAAGSVAAAAAGQRPQRIQSHASRCPSGPGSGWCGPRRPGLRKFKLLAQLFQYKNL